MAKAKAKKTVLITGAAGGIATHLRRELAGRYRLRLSDLRPVKPLGAGESFVRGDIAKLSDMLRATKSVDAVADVERGRFPRRRRRV